MWGLSICNSLFIWLSFFHLISPNISMTIFLVWMLRRHCLFPLGPSEYLFAQRLGSSWDLILWRPMMPFKNDFQICCLWDLTFRLAKAFPPPLCHMALCCEISVFSSCLVSCLYFYWSLLWQPYTCRFVIYLGFNTFIYFLFFWGYSCPRSSTFMFTKIIPRWASRQIHMQTHIHTLKFRLNIK